MALDDARGPFERGIEAFVLFGIRLCRTAFLLMVRPRHVARRVMADSGAPPDLVGSVPFVFIASFLVGIDVRMSALGSVWIFDAFDQYARALARELQHVSVGRSLVVALPLITVAMVAAHLLAVIASRNAAERRTIAALVQYAFGTMWVAFQTTILALAAVVSAGHTFSPAGAIAIEVATNVLPFASSALLVLFGLQSVPVATSRLRNWGASLLAAAGVSACALASVLGSGRFYAALDRIAPGLDGADRRSPPLAFIDCVEDGGPSVRRVDQRCSTCDVELAIPIIVLNPDSAPLRVYPSARVKIRHAGAHEDSSEASRSIVALGTVTPKSAELDDVYFVPTQGLRPGTVLLRLPPERLREFGCGARAQLSYRVELDVRPLSKDAWSDTVRSKWWDAAPLCNAGLLATSAR